MKPVDIWIVNKDEVLAETIASMLVVNELVSDFKIFESLQSLEKEINTDTPYPKAILAENNTDEDYWGFASKTTYLEQNKFPNLYLMGEKFNNDDLDKFDKNNKVKRLFKKPLRLDELKWIVEEIK